MGIAKLIKKRAVVSEHKNGETIKDIAKKYGLSTVTIRNYIKEDEEERKNKKAAEEKAAHQAAVKAARDIERRNTLKAREEIAKSRRQRVKADIQSGMTKEEIVKREGISRATINDYLRGDVMPAGAETYKEALCPAVKKRTIREWANEQIAREIRTPQGKMTVCEVYPNFMRLTTGSYNQTFTLGELYYMNVG